jgi:type I restriction modification DNA specificity protein
MEKHSTAMGLDPGGWRYFQLQDLFSIERGRGPRKKDLDGGGTTPFVRSSDSHNGWTGFTTMSPCHPGNTIGVNRNGSVGEAFYQPISFCSTEDVHIFTPKFEMNPFIALFLTVLIRRERYRFGYGRKWGIERMNQTRIKLPVVEDGQPNWKFMERYVKSLPFSSQVTGAVAE